MERQWGGGGADAYNDAMSHLARVMVAAAALVATAQAQTPQPFPSSGGRFGTAAPGSGRQTVPATAAGGQIAPAAPAAPATPANPETGAPTQAELGYPVYPSAQFLGSYDAGRGQRYYVYGTTAAFAEIVTYYRTQLNERGNLVFREPPTHMFEVGRFREETMAFPPGVTVKDWTWGGSGGYFNPKLGAQPARFPTVIMFVPPPAAAAPAPAAPPQAVPGRP